VTIRPGDLVMVVRPTPCCGDKSAVGKIYKVGAVALSDFACGCGAEPEDLLAAFDVANKLAFEVTRLIRIDPLSEPESVTQEEGVGA